MILCLYLLQPLVQIPVLAQVLTPHVPVFNQIHLSHQLHPQTLSIKSENPSCFLLKVQLCVKTVLNAIGSTKTSLKM